MCVQGSWTTEPKAKARAGADCNSRKALNGDSTEPEMPALVGVIAVIVGAPLPPPTGTQVVPTSIVPEPQVSPLPLPVATQVSPLRVVPSPQAMLVLLQPTERTTAANAAPRTSTVRPI